MVVGEVVGEEEEDRDLGDNMELELDRPRSE